MCATQRPAEKCVEGTVPALMTCRHVPQDNLANTVTGNNNVVTGNDNVGNTTIGTGNVVSGWMNKDKALLPPLPVAGPVVVEGVPIVTAVPVEGQSKE